MKMNPTVVLISLLGVVCVPRSSSNECSVNDLRHYNSIQCQITSGEDNESKGTSKKVENTTCVAIKGDTIHYVTCVDGSWQETGLAIHKDINKIHRSWGVTPHHGRSKRGFWSGLVCVISLFTLCDTWGGRSGPSRDNTPPVINNCPAPIYVIAKPVQTYAVVVWEEPTAHDDREGDIKPVRRGSGPHYSFSEERSPHHITYTAKDNSGNEAKCEMSIHVTVIRCPEIEKISNGYYICHPSTDYVLGASCQFGCYEGFELDGISQITCTDQKIWTGHPPRCKPLICPPLSPIEGASPSCTNNHSFRSICSFDCKKGFDMPPHVSKALVCQNDKTWRKHGEPRCKDIEAPLFNTCPSMVIMGTDVGWSKGQLIWKEPTVEDNSGEVITPVQSSNSLKLGSYQSAGIYVISYSASDAEGNKARDCVFKVVIRDSRCPRLYPTPFMQISCPYGYRTGAICNISCDPGKVMVGKTEVKCEEAYGGISGTWNWGSKQAICNDTNNCVQLKPPKNGALACDNWLGGVFCQYQCKDNYDSLTDWRKLTVCQMSGKWRPHIEPFNCVQLYTGGESQQTHVDIKAEYYFSGDCNNETTKTEIQQNFITVLNSSLWTAPCDDNPKCNVGNVQIYCGPSSQDRERREASVHPSKEARNDKNEKSLVTVEIKMIIKSLINESYIDIRTKYVGLISTLETAMSSIVSDQSLAKLNTTFNSVTNNGLILDCPEGSIQAKNSFGCILCPEGSYFNTASRLCLPCGKATYQDELGQLHCKPCPMTTTTRRTGSTDYGDCEDACKPGSSSYDGSVPCSLCEVGYYQSLHGQMDCVRCPGSMSTLSIGSTDIADCNEFDIELPWNITKTISLQLQDGIWLEDFYISFWIQRMNINSNGINMSLVSSYGNAIVKFEDMGFLHVGQESNFSLNLTVVDERWHKVLILLQRCNLTVSVDGQVILEVKLLRSCQQTLSFKEVFINAGNEFVGGISQLNIGTDIYGTIAVENRCFHSDLPDLLSWYEFGAANMTGAFIRTPSDCDDFDNCLSSPCLNGSCSDAINSFLCECFHGFTGTQCEINIDDCSANICMNNASCIDGVQSYSCACEGNHTGAFCEIEMANGEWGTWSNWSECSTTCGQGEHKRIRFCDSPVPDNGGRECLGNSSDFTPCNNTECPVCSTILAPSKGTISCSKNSGSLNCTLMCNKGYDFDIEPLDYYFCGPETFFEWNFQTAINPLHRLPECTAISMPDFLSVQYSAKYRDLYCTGIREAAVRNFINKQTEKVIQDAPCIKSQICSLEGVAIHNCDGLKRRKRATTTVDFQLSLSTSPRIAANGTETLNSLQDAFNLIQEAADKGEFTITLQGDEYELDRNLTDVTGKAICPPELTRVQFYCVPCGKGSMLYTDYCKKCDIGFYQDMERQRFCFQCPKDRTTLGIGSTTIEDCSVHLEPIPEGKELVAIALGSVFGVATILVIAVFIYGRKRSLRNRKISAIMPSDSSTSKFSALISFIELDSDSTTSVSPTQIQFVTPISVSSMSVSSEPIACSLPNVREHANGGNGNTDKLLPPIKPQGQRHTDGSESDIDTNQLTLISEPQYKEDSYADVIFASLTMFGLGMKKPPHHKQKVKETILD